MSFTRFKMQVVEWLNCIDTYFPDLKEELLTLSGEYKETPVSVFSPEEFERIAIDFFGERSFVPMVQLPVTIQNTDRFIAEKINDIFASWKSRNAENIIRAFYALSLEYEPLDNYNGEERHTTTFGKKTDITYGKSTDITYGKTTDITYGKSTDITYGKTDTTTRNQSETITETPNQYERTTTTNVYGFNSSAASPSDVVTESESGSRSTEKSYTGTGDTLASTGKDTHEDSGTDSNAESGTDTHTDSGTDSNAESGTETLSISKHGNLGLTTSQQMLDSELALRLQDFKYRVIHSFIAAYTIY